MLILTWGSLGLGVAKAAELSIADVAKHNTAQDCYMAINGKVYDVASYIDKHPGGANTIISVCGTEATTAFNTMGGKGRPHSSKANDMLQSYYLGQLNATVSLPVN